MDQKHKEILRANRLYLSEQLIVDDNIIPYLYQEGILTESQVEEILSQSSNKNKTLRLLSILPSRGPAAFSGFLSSLQKDFPWVRDHILTGSQDHGHAAADTEGSELQNVPGLK